MGGGRARLRRVWSRLVHRGLREALRACPGGLAFLSTVLLSNRKWKSPSWTNPKRSRHGRRLRSGTGWWLGGSRKALQTGQPGSVLFAAAILVQVPSSEPSLPSTRQRAATNGATAATCTNPHHGRHLQHLCHRHRPRRHPLTTATVLAASTPPPLPPRAPCSSPAPPRLACRREYLGVDRERIGNSNSIRVSVSDVFRGAGEGRKGEDRGDKRC